MPKLFLGAAVALKSNGKNSKSGLLVVNSGPTRSWTRNTIPTVLTKRIKVKGVTLVSITVGLQLGSQLKTNQQKDKSMPDEFEGALFTL